MSEETPKFESWAIVELFGHQRIAGRVTEQTIAGGALLRVDVPEQPAMPDSGWSSGSPAIPAYTRYFGAAAIYSMTPCGEAEARATAESIRARPPIVYRVPAIVATPQLTPPKPDRTCECAESNPIDDVCPVCGGYV